MSNDPTAELFSALERVTDSKTAEEVVKFIGLSASVDEIADFMTNRAPSLSWAEGIAAHAMWPLLESLWRKSRKVGLIMDIFFNVDAPRLFGYDDYSAYMFFMDSFLGSTFAESTHRDQFDVMEKIFQIPEADRACLTQEEAHTIVHGMIEKVRLGEGSSAGRVLETLRIAWNSGEGELSFENTRVCLLIVRALLYL